VVTAVGGGDDGPGGVRPGSGAMFDRIAHRYDLLNRVLSLGADRRWRRHAVASLGLAARARVLDLATGTGDVAFELLRQCPDSLVIGLDPGLAMLALARRKAAGRTGLLLVAGDAQSLPFRDGRLDAATMAFGIRNVPDRARALGEIARVLRGHGRLAVLELGEPRRGPFAVLARVWLRTVVPWLGGMLSGSGEYHYLQRSMAAFPPPSEFAAVMEAAGLTEVSVTPMMLGTVCLFAAASGTGR
jgi:demethylmenaquinone methyltransferase / 2-methoxy-6-polyprenyl-1,4-benzoquinol methylase